MISSLEAVENSFGTRGRLGMALHRSLAQERKQGLNAGAFAIRQSIDYEQ